MLCTLYSMNAFTWTEFHWISRNYALLASAMRVAEELLPYDATEITVDMFKQTHTALKANAQAGAQLLASLQELGGLQVDKATVAFAAAYLTHYMNAEPDDDEKINDKILPRIILDILKHHTRIGAGGKPELRKYDTAGQHLSEYIEKNIDQEKKGKRWKLKNSGTSP